MELIGVTIYGDFNIRPTTSVTFKYCIFVGDKITINKHGILDFEHCNFKARSSLVISGSSGTFSHCMFEKGSKIESNTFMIMNNCDIAPNCDIFSGRQWVFKFSDCVFKMGKYNFSNFCANPEFRKCCFNDGSVLKFAGTHKIVLEECKFNNGCLIDNHPGASVSMERCWLPQNIFANNLGIVSFTRTDLIQELNYLPHCEHLFVLDECKKMHEIEQELHYPLCLPKAGKVRFFSNYEMKKANSIDILIESLMEYPNMSIASIAWKGDDDLFDKLMQVNDPLVRKNLTNLLTLVSSICVKRLGARSALRKLPLEIFKMCHSFLTM